MIRSFDLFDTLLGRFNYRPESIFDVVEQRFPFPGFAFYRTAAEFKSNHTLPDIYRQFQEITGISKKQAALLMDFEFQMELNQVFPIVENCSQVQDGDLVISDTIYSKKQIQQILKKIGLKKRVQIYATPFGKYKGTIWDVVKKKHPISLHLGDHPISDVHRPKENGIDAFFYAGSHLSPAEQLLVNIGATSLAYLMRALRLQNPYPPQSPEYFIWNEQSQLNIPLLIQSSLYLDQFCRENKKSRILFTTRDGCLWIRIFKVLFPQYESIEFHTSRLVYMNPTHSFIEYVKGLYSDDAVIVDGQGTGIRCTHFFREHLQREPNYLAIIVVGDKHHAIARRPHGQKEMEQMNYDLVGALCDVQNGNPVRMKPEYDLRFVYPSHRCVDKCLELLPQYSFQTYDLRIVNWAIDVMAGGTILSEHVPFASHHLQVTQDGKSKYYHVKNALIVEGE